MGQIKVLQTNKLYYPVTGGIERVVQQLAEGLSDKTDTTVLVCQKEGKAVHENINGAERCVIFLRCRFLCLMCGVSRKKHEKMILCTYICRFRWGILPVCYPDIKGKWYCGGIVIL